MLAPPPLLNDFSSQRSPCRCSCLADCVNHEWGNAALAERCQGFQDAIAASSLDVEFVEHFSVPQDNEEEFILTVTEKVGDEGDWEGVGFLHLAASSFPALRRVLEKHPAAVAGTFDLKDYIFDALDDQVLSFSIDQQQFLQGNLPVYLLSYFAYTQQTVTNHLIESGPSFITESPSDALKVCEANNFAVCPDRPEEDMSYISAGLTMVGCAMFGIVGALGIWASLWTYTNRGDWVVNVSQPIFLGLVILGTLISSLSIIFMGFQTSYRLARDESGEFTDRENPDIGMVDAVSSFIHFEYQQLEYLT